jgi:Tol biopolymer transport system component
MSALRSLDFRGVPMQTLRQDLKYALRMLAKAPGFAAIAILTLALGIGANTALFSVVNGVLLNPLTYPHPNQLVAVGERLPGFSDAGISYPNFLDWQRENKSFQALAIYRPDNFNLTGMGAAERVTAMRLSASFFPAFGVRPLIGRNFTAQDDHRASAPVAMLGAGFWKTKFGGSPDVLGKTLTLDGTDYTVIGVVPASFDFRDTYFRPSDVYVAVGLANGIRQEHTSGPGLKVSAQFLSDDRIGYVMKAGRRMGLAFTTGDQGANGEMRNPSWSPDGKRVVYQKWFSESWRQNQPLFSMDPEFDLAYSDPFPAFSHDGKKLAVTHSVSNAGTGSSSLLSVSVMNADGTNAKLIFHGEQGGLALAPQWSPNDEWIAFGGGFYFLPRGRPARIMMMRPDGSELHELTKTAGNSGFPSWSPDGKRMVFRFWGEPEYGLRLINLDDGTSTKLTTGFDNFPSWSPKGDLIVFTRFSEDDYDIYTIRPDGTGLRRLTTTPGNDAHAVWSPDGKHILFSSARLGFKDEAPLYDGVPQPYGELFVMDADSSNQRPLTDNQWEDATPAWAPVSLP